MDSYSSYVSSSARASQNGSKTPASSPFALLGAASNQQQPHGQEETGTETLGFGFKQLITKLQALTAQTKAQDLAAQKLAVDASQLLLTDAQLTAINPQTFSANNLTKLLADPSISAELKGFLQKLQQLVAKLNLQTTNPDGSLTSLDLSKVDLSKLTAEEFELFKKLAFADIAGFLNKPKVHVVNGQETEELPQGPSFLDKDTSLSDLLALPQVVQVLEVLNRLQVKLPDTGFSLDAQPILQLNTDGLTTAQAQALVDFAAQTFAVVQAQQVAKPIGFDLAALAGQPLNATHISSFLPSSKVTTQQKDLSASGVTNGLDTSALVNVETPVIGLTFAQKAIASSLLASAQNTAKAQAQLKLNPAAASIAAIDEKAFNGTDFGAGLSEFDSFLSGTSSTLSQAGGTTSGKGLVGQAPANQSMHMATSQVQVLIQKLADKSNGKNDNAMVIQLDPAELGRVRVKLSFGDSGAIKARVLVERPETLVLLQKEASSLERGLQNAGYALSSDDGLSFDLSQQQSFSGSMSDGQSQRHSGGATEPLEQLDEATFLDEAELVDIEVDDGRINVKV